jgi:hypothetical protein
MQEAAMSKQIIPINEKYQIEFDHPNYTLQVSYFSKRDNKIKWLDEGYYSSIVSAVKKFIKLDSMRTVITAVDKMIAEEIDNVIESANRW